MEITYTRTGGRGRPKSNLPEAYLNKVRSMENGEGYTMPSSHKEYFKNACKELGLNFTFKREKGVYSVVTGYAHTWGSNVASERLAAIKVDSDVPIPEIRKDTVENLVYGLRVGDSFEIPDTFKHEIFDSFKRHKFQYTSRIERYEDGKLIIRIWRIK